MMDKKLRRFFTMHINIDDLLPASADEKKQHNLMRESTSFFKDGFRRLWHNKVAMTCAFILGFIILAIIFIPMFWPYTYDQQLGIKQGEPVDGSYGNLGILQYGVTEKIQKAKYKLGLNNDDYEYQVSDTAIQYKKKTETEWNDLVTLVDLAESKGYKAKNGEIEFSVNEEKAKYVEWRYKPVEIAWETIAKVSEIGNGYDEKIAAGATLYYKVDGDYLKWSIENADDADWYNVCEYNKLPETIQDQFSKNNTLEYQIADGNLQARKYQQTFWSDLIKITRISTIEPVNVFPHLFGTDEAGRDYFIRVVYGTRVSLAVGLFASLIVLVIGIIYGSISGFAGGKVDLVMMRFVDIIYALPDMLIIILLSVVLKQVLGDKLTGGVLSTLGPNMISIFIVFGLLYWVSMARLIRGQILSLKEQEYVLAARSIGAKPARIIIKHLLPNCISVIIISTALQIPSAIFTESYLSFLGLGVAAPMPSLGSLASDALGGVFTYTYLLIIPALVICLIVLSLNLLGDGLRDAFDPKLQRTRH